MEILIGSELRIKDPTPELLKWCEQELVLENPEYKERKRRGLWTGKTPTHLYLYRTEGTELVLPVGVGHQIRTFIGSATVTVRLADNGLIEYPDAVPLYDYQVPAVDAMYQQSCGILQAPCGSGKTQMGIALAEQLSRKTLWVTHTQDLLSQSYERAAQYIPREQLGKITAGRVQIGTHMTFATVQTLCKLDLKKYEFEWDVVIIDECHRLAGTPTKMMMFYKVVNSLAARYKYGLSATVHRSDGLIKSTFAAIGPVIYQVPEAAVAEKTMRVRICRMDTEVETSSAFLDTDGTLIYSELLTYLAEHPSRNRMIAELLRQETGHSCLVLSSRLQQLRNIMELLPPDLREKAVMIDGSMNTKKGRAEREAAIEQMRTGEKSILFASFGLAKEGLDIPRLDRLVMAMPQKDYAVVTQCIGRIARTAEGKTDAVCYDLVDAIPFCENQWKRRRAHYRKAGCEF